MPSQPSLSPNAKYRVASYLRLADGFFRTAVVSSSSSEFQVRNALSRLYYAFFHVSLAYLLSTGADVTTISRNHGNVHTAVRAAAGKYVGEFVIKLYHYRMRSDYDVDMIDRMYGGDLDTARKESLLELSRAKANFSWMYITAREAIKNP